jgi:hypothetical protein
MIGPDNIAWECGYPHSDSSWPYAPDELAQVAADVPVGDLDKITYQNAMRWYSFDPFAFRPEDKCAVGARHAEESGHDVSTVSRDKGRFTKSAGVNCGTRASTATAWAARPDNAARAGISARPALPFIAVCAAPRSGAAGATT